MPAPTDIETTSANSYHVGSASVGFETGRGGLPVVYGVKGFYVSSRSNVRIFSLDLGIIEAK